MITKQRIDGIPLLEYVTDLAVTPKGIVFIVHGHTGQKELGNLEKYPIELMRRGYRVLVIDAYKHGERIEEPYLSQQAIDKTLAMPEVVFHTTMDIIHLYEKYYRQISDNLIVSGISMGGHVAFQIPKYYPFVKTILPFIGSPNIPSHYYQTKKKFLGEAIELCRKEVDALRIDDISPYLTCNIAMVNGTFDDVVEARFAKAFYDLLKPNHLASLSYKEYPCAHEVTDNMILDVLSFLDALSE